MPNSLGLEAEDGPSKAAQIYQKVTIAENSLRHDIVIVWKVVILELAVPLRRLDGGCL